MRARLIPAILLAVRLLAQDDEDKDDGKKAYIDLKLDSNGHGRLTVSFEGVSGLDQFLTEPVQRALTQPLGCETPTRAASTVEAFCPGLLTLAGPNLRGTIRLDSLFQPLFDLGIDDVIAFVHVPDAALNPTDSDSNPDSPQWTQVLREGAGLRYGHRSGHRHYLPPPLSLEYPARHQAAAGALELRLTLAAIGGILFLPALAAAWLTRRASLALAADPDAAIGEEALWFDLLLQLTGLFWIGLLGTLDLQDLARSLFPGQPLPGALFAFTLLVLPPLLGIINCLGVWFPVLERAGLAAGLTFGQTITRYTAHCAKLLMPAAALSIVIELLPRNLSGSLIAIAIMIVVSLTLAFLSGQNLFSGARQIQGGELFARAQSLAKLARTRLNVLLILSPQTPPNAFAMPGKQIVLSPAFLQDLSKDQVDAVIAHELAHLRHNDFKNPILVYAVYLSVLAPLLSHLITPWLHPAWMLLPQSLILILLMGFLSRHAEYRADRLAAELVSPEAITRALCRIRRHGRQPLSLHPFSEALLSHPSFLNRARAIAHDHQQSSEWLRRILSDEAENRPTPTDTYATPTPETAPPPVLVASH